MEGRWGGRQLESGNKYCEKWRVFHSRETQVCGKEGGKESAGEKELESMWEMDKSDRPRCCGGWKWTVHFLEEETHVIRGWREGWQRVGGYFEMMTKEI